MSKVQSIIEEIKGLSLLEASELVKGLEEALGVIKNRERKPEYHQPQKTKQHQGIGT